MDYLHDLNTFLPGIIVAIGGLLVLLTEAFKKKVNLAYYLTLGVLLFATLFAFRDLFNPAGVSFYGMIAYGGVSAFGILLILLGTLFCVALSRDYLESIDHHI